MWSVMNDIEFEIKTDFIYLKNKIEPGQNVLIHDGAHILGEDQLYLGSNVQIMPGAVIDATNGPVWIGDNCVVESLAAEKDCTPSQVALAWLIQQPGVTSAIVGPRTVSHLEDNLEAVPLEISDDDRRRLNEVAEPELAIVPYYHGSMIDFKPSQYSWY